MTLTTATIHLNLAVYLSDAPLHQVVKMAKRYKKRSNRPRVRKAMNAIINCHDPVALVTTVYNEDIA